MLQREKMFRWRDCWLVGLFNVCVNTTVAIGLNNRAHNMIQVHTEEQRPVFPGGHPSK